MKLDDKLINSSKAIEDVNYHVDLTKKEMIKHPKTKYIISTLLSIIILLIVLITPTTIKTISFINDFTKEYFKPPLAPNLLSTIDYGKLYRMKYSEEDIESIRVYYYDKEKEIDENNIFDIITSIKLKRYSDINDIKIDENKYEIIKIKADIKAHLVYDISSDKQIDEIFKYTLNIYNLNNINLNNDLIVAINEHKIINCGEVKNNQCLFQPNYFSDINYIHEAIIHEDNYYMITLDKLHEVFDFYKHYLLDQEEIPFEFIYLELEPNNTNEKHKYIINTYEQLLQLSYNDERLSKYNEEYFNNNVLLIYEINLDHVYGSFVGDSEITNVYYQAGNICLECVHYKTHKLTYKFRKLMLVEVNKEHLKAYNEFIVYDKYVDDNKPITEVSPSTIFISTIPTSTDKIDLKASIKDNSIKISGVTTHQLNFILFKKNKNEIEIIYQLGEESQMSIDAMFEMPSEFIEGVTSFKFTQE